jgi:hypothetical protein
MLQNTDYSLDVLFVSWKCILSEALQEIEHKIKSIMIYFLQICLEFTRIAFLEFFLNKLHFI